MAIVVVPALFSNEHQQRIAGAMRGGCKDMKVRMAKMDEIKAWLENLNDVLKYILENPETLTEEGIDGNDALQRRRTAEALVRDYKAGVKARAAEKKEEEAKEAEKKQAAAEAEMKKIEEEKQAAAETEAAAEAQSNARMSAKADLRAPAVRRDERAKSAQEMRDSHESRCMCSGMCSQQ